MNHDASIPRAVARGITKARVRAGLSQRRLAIMVDAAPSTLCKIERYADTVPPRATAPSLDLLERLCKALRTSALDLLVLGQEG